MTHSINMPYDSEVLAMEQVIRQLEEMRRSPMNPQDFVDRAKDMFAKIGLEADVNFFYAGEVKGHHPITGEPMVEQIPQYWEPEITIKGRIDKHDFDHDQMAREVRSNILQLPGKGGVIKAEKNTDEIVKKLTKGHHH